ncbi:DUF573 domain-containing protein [Cephalotus follicularis]|uniref:DUF573 domain-containing protein n=1 Tax=Cephalotus follicularis TaxID=3775 RepID=A0A1Q3DDL5_CEPFO|nr:DUF573 domain-containing protein [Cephalotus follicularis]
MASQQHDAVFDQSLDEDDEESSQSQDEDDLELNDDVLLPNDDALMEDEEDEELEEEEDLNSPSTSSPIIVTPSVTVALPAATPSATAVTVASIPNGNNSESTPDLKRPRIETTLIVHEERKPAPAPFDESRRLFQRLWTDEDEIELLQGFLDYTATRGGTSGTHHHHHHNDTALFYDQIKSKLQLDFNKNQLVEKLRRLKKKFRNVLNRIGSGKEFAFKSAHDQATFEISRKIWGNSGGRGSVDDTVLDDEEVNVSVNPNFSNFEVKSEYFATDKKLTPTPATSRSRKRSRPSKSGVKTEDNVAINAGNNESIGVGGNVIEETVRSCLSPIFKELLSGGSSRFWSWRCIQSGWCWCRTRLRLHWRNCGPWEGDWLMMNVDFDLSPPSCSFCCT